MNKKLKLLYIFCKRSPQPLKGSIHPLNISVEIKANFERCIVFYKKLIYTCLFFCFHFWAVAQNGNFQIEGTPPFQIPIQKKSDEIKLDGVLDEATWSNAKKCTKFTQYFPNDGEPALGDTEIYMSYDDDFFYIAAKCYTPGNNFRVESLRRDFGFSRNDNINFIFDTYHDRTNAFQFSMNPVGALKEAQISIGGKSSSAFDGSWDNKWNGDAKMYDNYWTCEMAIPFSSIRYKANSTKWGFNCYRNDSQTNEVTTFIHVPRENNLMNLNYTAEIFWGEPLENPKKNISIIPYATAGISKDYEDMTSDGLPSNFSIGADAKIGVSSSLNLDLTVNPDFSQVEVDRQVTNLDRFEISFPEKRQFFLENADLFSGFGTGSARPFFSRRIGVSIDTLTENNIQNTIYGGMRLSGKLNERLRLGVLNLQAASQKENDLPSFNYTVAAAEQQIFDRSNIGFIMVNKQAINADDFSGSADTYDRVAGLEYRINSENNFWTGKLSYMKAFTPNDKEMKYYAFAQLEFNQRRYRVEWVSLIVGDGYDAEVGFVPRRDIYMMSPEFDIRFFPSNNKITQMTFSADSRLFYKLGKDDNEIITDYGREEIQLKLDWKMDFSNNHKLEFTYENKDFTLLKNFDPTRIQDDGLFFSAGTNINNHFFNIEYKTNPAKPFYFEIEPTLSSYYGGIRADIEGQFTFRKQPHLVFSLDYNYIYIDIGQSFQKANLWLVGPRIDVTFTKKIFWTSFIQYNNRLNNLNINSRFQWRFAPVSDFFIVYTDNYQTEFLDDINSRNRALVLKLTYWLNL